MSSRAESACRLPDLAQIFQCQIAYSAADSRSVVLWWTG